MLRYATDTVEIIGTLRGEIWMPCEECTKDVHEVFRMPAARNSRYYTRGQWPGSLRDALCNITNDGDFRVARLDPDAVMIVTRVSRKTGALRRRIVALKTDGSNADCFGRE